MRVWDVHLDVPLFCWKLNSPLVKAVTDAVRSSASDCTGTATRYTNTVHDTYARIQKNASPLG